MKSFESIKAVEKLVKDYVYPKVKFFSDSDSDYNEPDFTAPDDENSKQTIKIVNQLLQLLSKSHYDLKNKVLFWVAYRKEVKTIVQGQRYASVRRFKKNYLEGELSEKLIDTVVSIMIHF